MIMHKQSNFPSYLRQSDTLLKAQAIISTQVISLVYFLSAKRHLLCILNILIIDMTKINTYRKV